MRTIERSKSPFVDHEIVNFPYRLSAMLQHWVKLQPIFVHHVESAYVAIEIAVQHMAVCERRRGKRGEKRERERERSVSERVREMFVSDEQERRE